MVGRQERNGHGGTPPEHPTITFSPSAEFPPLNETELAALHEVGRRWRSDLRDRPPRDAVLPLDPSLEQYRHPPAPSRFHRLGRIEMFRTERRGQLTATGPTSSTDTRIGRVTGALRRALLGPPLASAAVLQERMRKLIALPVLSSDLLSSVAYGPEAMLAILVLAGSGALGLSLPIAAALVILMITVGTSYRQTVYAYPHGAGSYLVASDSLGPRFGLTAAAGLILDYVLTVSVSVAAGVQAITSALPGLTPFTVPFGLLVIAGLLAGNLRGVRAAGKIFAAPTYLFIAAIGLLFVVGVARAAGRGFEPVPPPPVGAVEGLGLLVVLRAFASGAASMTGIEAVADAVPAFRPVEWRQARTTLTWMVAILVVLFAGLTLLIHFNGLVPRADETLLSQLARETFRTGPWYALIQAATTLVLLLAANTAFNDFPRLLFFMARDSYAPRRFLHMGDRLAFSNGIIALAVAAALIFVAFGGYTQSLIPLYAVGVFLAFTLSQSGMVMHWRRHRAPGWRWRAALNATGAVLCALVLVTAAITKFVEGAWVVVVAVPLLVLLCLHIRWHYDAMRQALTLPATTPGTDTAATRPDGRTGAERTGAAEQGRRPNEVAETTGPGDLRVDLTPGEVRHLVVVPVARLNLAALRALAYAASLGQPAFAVHLSPEQEEADRFRRQWETWGDHLRLETIISPYRTVIAPLAQYVEALHSVRPEVTLTVVVPEIVVRHLWHQLLHTRTELRLRRALRDVPGVVVTSVPVHLPE
ncbi:APC family permease [Plantactinospora sp. BB1]|uniref:APC family permease n=1 Tax=Plantactinospora sp. BB1 TaxID=2071627 RepID=UPI000D1759CF|nr:APC family permease [Plantactinospora sp. BB1]AVT35724.1 amino acid permease [Plantactinospora sp. BB1]